MSPSLRWTLPAAGLVLAGSAVAVHIGSGGPDLRQISARLPDPDRLEALSYYLTPVADDSIGVASAAPPPVSDPFDAPAAMRLGPVASEPPPEAPLDVSAIFVSAGRRVAIVNQRTVRPGDALPGGAVVESIESDRVVVVDAAGRRRVLRF